MTRIVCIADLHTGSHYSLMPAEVKLEVCSSGGTGVVTPNARQKKLLQFWEQSLDEIGRVDACVCLGDMTDGSMIRSRGYELWAPSIHQQIRTAADLLGMIRTSRYYGVDGSPYHAGSNPSWDLLVMDELCGEFGTDLVVNTDGHRIHCAHHTPVTRSAASQHSGAAAENVWCAANAPYYGEFSLRLRGHKHVFERTTDIYGDVVKVPCWKIADDYMRRGGLSWQPPQVGYVLLDVRPGHEIEVSKHVWVGTREDRFTEVYL